MKAGYPKGLLVFAAASLMLVPFSVRATAQVRPSFLYSLSSFSGKAPYSDVRVRIDRQHDEIYVLDRGLVRIYNDTGMEVFWFGDDLALGSIYDLAVDEEGAIFLLSYDYSNPGSPQFSIVRCNYRGEPREQFSVSAFPPEFSPFFPNSMYYRDGALILVSTNGMKAVVTDLHGVFRKGYDFAAILEIPEADRPNTEISGFSVDRAGNFLFTVSVMFRAFVVSPEGKVTGSFGKAGSAPGLFGIVGGIAADDRGNYLVVERLRSVVMIFDKEFRFVQEFGYRGNRPGNLIRPSDLVVGNSSKIYVTQVRDRGVSVFSISAD